MYEKQFRNGNDGKKQTEEENVLKSNCGDHLQCCFNLDLTEKGNAIKTTKITRRIGKLKIKEVQTL